MIFKNKIKMVLGTMLLTCLSEKVVLTLQKTDRRLARRHIPDCSDKDVFSVSCCIASHCIALHRIASHYIALHCIACVVHVVEAIIHK
jgi:hypothetical protein